MAELFETDGRKYFKLVTGTHEHRLYLDEIDRSGNGTTSRWVDHPDKRTFAPSSSDHEHHIVEWKVESARLWDNISIRWETHTHEDVGYGELVLAKEEQLHEEATRTDRETLEDSGVIVPETDYDADDPLTDDMVNIQDDVDDATEFDEEGNLILNLAFFDISDPDALEISGFTRYGADPNVVIAGTPIPSLTARSAEDNCRVANSINTDVVPIDWTQRTEEEPFFAENTLEYSITVEACKGFVPNTNKGPTTCSPELEQAAARGILHLAKFYNKRLPPDRAGQLDLLQSVETEYYLDERPRARAKVLVKVPARTFELLPDISEDPSIDPSTGQKRFRFIRLDALTIRSQIDNIVVSLIDFARIARNQHLRITCLNVKNEAKRLGEFFTALKNLLAKNCFFLEQATQETGIEIGFTEGYEVAYVLFDQKPASVGFSAFQKTYPMSNPTTIAYVSKLNEMEADLALSNSPSLTEFLLKYTYPRPQIIVGVPEETFSLAREAGNHMEEFQNRFDDATRMPKRPFPKWPKIENIGDVAGLASNTGRVGRGIETARETRQTINDIYTSATERRREDQKIADPNFIQTAFSDVSVNTHYVGDIVLGNLRELAAQLEGDIEGLFSEILNKIDIGTIAQFAAAITMGEFPNLGSFLECATKTFFDKVNQFNRTFFESTLNTPNLDLTWQLTALTAREDQLGLLRASVSESTYATTLNVFRDINILDNKPMADIIEHFRNVTTAYINFEEQKIEGLIQEICISAELNSSITTTPLLEELGIAVATLIVYIKILQIIVPSLSGSSFEGDLAVILGATTATLKIAEQLCDPKKGDIFDIPKLPVTPSIELGRLPTFDFMGWVLPNLADEFRAFIIDIALETIKAVIDIDIDFDPSGICSCVDPSLNLNVASSLSYGELDIGSIIADQFAGPPDSRFDVFAHVMSICLEIPSGANLSVLGAHLKELLEEISLQLTPDEIFSLLRGTSSMRVIRLISTTLNTEKYNNIRGFFGDPTNLAKIIDVFENLGKYFDLAKSQSWREEVASNRAEGLSASERREQLLINKYGYSLSADDIKRETEKNAGRACSRAVKFLQFSPTSPASEISIPPIIGGSSALIPRNPPSVQHMMNRTIETMFESIIMVFEQAVHGPLGFIQTLCFKSGMRSVYEMLKQQDEMMKNMPPPLGLGPAGVPLFDIAPPEGYATRFVEINGSIMGVVKNHLEGIEFEEGESGLSFVLNTHLGRIRDDIIWNIEEGTPYEHILKIPTSNRPPFKLNHEFQIKTNQKDISETIFDAADLRILDGKDFNDLHDPRVLFSVIASQDLRDEDSGFDEEPIVKYLEGVAYYRTMTDIIKMFTNKLLKSKRILNAEVDNLENPEESIINWRLEPKSDTSGETQTTLLGLEELREKTKERYEKSTAQESEGATDDIQKALLASVVEATVRLHVVELFLKTLPVFDTFKKDSIISDEFVGYIALKVQEACVRQDPFWPGYYENILDHVKELYEEEWNLNNKSLKDPITEVDLSSPEEIELKGAMDYFIKKTILDMSNTLEELSMIRSGTRDSVYEIFLKNMMYFENKGSQGVFNVPTAVVLEDDSITEFLDVDQVYKDRFEDFLLDEEGKKVEFEFEDDVLRRKTKLRSGLETFKDGGLLLEKYIQYDVNGVTKIKSLSEGILVTEDQEIRYFIAAIKNCPIWLDDDNNATFDSSVSRGPGPQAWCRSVVNELNRLPLLDRINVFENADADVPELKELVSNVKVGLRLVYVPELELNDDDLEDHAANLKNISSSFVFANKRTFRIIERFMGLQKTEESRRWEESATYRSTYPLPLISVTKDIDFEDIENIQFRDHKKNLINKMIKDERFKLLFEHCFPLQKILSIITIYIEVVFSTAGDERLTSVFDQTRSTLKSMFDSIINTNDFSYRDRNTEAAGGNAGLLSGRTRRVFSDGRPKVAYNNETASFVIV